MKLTYHEAKHNQPELWFRVNFSHLK